MLGARTAAFLRNSSRAATAGLRANATFQSNRLFASIPTTADKVVHVTFCTDSGERLRVPALVGRSLFDVAVENKVVVGDAYTCHVILDPESYALHPPPKDEEVSELNQLTDVERTPTSRIASFLELVPGVPETICALGDVRDFAVP